MFGVIPTHRTYAYCSNAAISNGVYSMVVLSCSLALILHQIEEARFRTVEF